MNEENDKSELPEHLPYIQTNINIPTQKNLSEQNDSNAQQFNVVINFEHDDEMNPENISVLNHEMTFIGIEEGSNNLLDKDNNIGKKNFKIEEVQEGNIDGENETQDLSSFDPYNSDFPKSLTEAAEKYEFKKGIDSEQSIKKNDEESNNPTQNGNQNTPKPPCESESKAKDGHFVAIVIKKLIFEIIKQDRKRKKRRKGKANRLYDKDNIRKKYQGYAFQWIKSKLNVELTKNNISSEFDFPLSLTTNVSIKENKKFLNMTIKELLLDKYEYEKKDDKKAYNIVVAEKNKKTIQSLKDKNIEKIEIILKKKLKDVYIEYIESNSFKEKVKKLGKKYPSQYISKFIKDAKNIVKYYEEKKIRKK